MRADLAAHEGADGLRVGVVARGLLVRADLSRDRVEARRALLVGLQLLDRLRALVELGGDAIVLLLLLGVEVAVLRGRRLEQVLRLVPRGLAKIVLALDVLGHLISPFGNRL